MVTTKKYDSILTVDICKKIKAIAVILMIYHHFFGFPENILVPNAYFNWSIGQVFPIEILARQFKICVSIFAFISGYGFCIKMNERNKWSILKSSIVSVINLLVVYCAITILVGIWNCSSIIDIVQNLLLYKINILYSAWYIKYYLEIIIIFTLYSFCGKKKLLIEVYFSGMLLLVGWLTMDTGFIEYFPVTLAGFYCCKYCVYNKAEKKFQDKKIFYAGMIVTLFIISLYARHILEDIIKPFTLNFIVIIPLMLILRGIVGFCEKIKVDKLLLFISKYSTYYWLLHSIFQLSNGKELMLQKIAYWPYFSTIITIWIFVLMTPIIIVLEKILSKLSKIIIDKIRIKTTN